MRKNINIQVSGGTASFHDVIQGEQVTIGQSSQLVQTLGRSFDELHHELTTEGRRLGESDERIAELRQEIEELRTLLTTRDVPKQDLQKRIAFIKENFAWTGPIIAKALTAVVPQLAPIL